MYDIYSEKVMEHFKNPQNIGEMKDADSSNFYKNFRCGLLHAGCIESGGYISYDQGQFCISNNDSLIVNPHLLIQRVHKNFNNLHDIRILH